MSALQPCWVFNRALGPAHECLGGVKGKCPLQKRGTRALTPCWATVSRDFRSQVTQLFLICIEVNSKELLGGQLTCAAKPTGSELSVPAPSAGSPLRSCVLCACWGCRWMHVSYFGMWATVEKEARFLSGVSVTGIRNRHFIHSWTTYCSSLLCAMWQPLPDSRIDCTMLLWGLGEVNIEYLIPRWMPVKRMSLRQSAGALSCFV